jgi:hypothetical protein
VAASVIALVDQRTVFQAADPGFEGGVHGVPFIVRRQQ